MSKATRKHLHSNKRNGSSFDNAVMLFGFIEPVFILPQLFKIYDTQNASGLSLLTWCLYIVSSLVMIVWGVKRQLKPIYIPQLAWIIFEILIVIGIVKYG